MKFIAWEPKVSRSGLEYERAGLIIRSKVAVWSLWHPGDQDGTITVHKLPRSGPSDNPIDSWHSSAPVSREQVEAEMRFMAERIELHLSRPPNKSRRSSQ